MDPMELLRRGRAGGSPQCMQIASEFESFIEILRAHHVGSIVEVGTWEGGTAIVLALYGFRVLTIDPVDRGVRQFIRDHDVADRVTPLIADGRAPTVLSYVRDWCGPVGADAAFIDNDHLLVHEDFACCAPLVKPGGVIALHDICYEDDRVSSVPRFWHGLKVAHPDMTFSEIVSQEALAARGYGIGWFTKCDRRVGAGCSDP